jgi:hypothetical protein
MAQSSFKHTTQGVKAMPTGSQIGGVTYFTGTGTPKSVVTPVAIGDNYTDVTNGNEWVATGVTSSSWVMVIQGVGSGNGIIQTAVASYTLAQLNANPVIVAAQAGHTLTPVYVKIWLVGTATSGGPVLIKDTSGTVSVLSVTFGALATAVGQNPPCICSDQNAITGVTWGAGMGGALTAANGIQLTGGTLVGLTSCVVMVQYMVS